MTKKQGFFFALAMLMSVALLFAACGKEWKFSENSPSDPVKEIFKALETKNPSLILENISPLQRGIIEDALIKSGLDMTLEEKLEHDMERLFEVDNAASMKVKTLKLQEEKRSRTQYTVYYWGVFEMEGLDGKTFKKEIPEEEKRPVKIIYVKQRWYYDYI